jgi:hypothetical protein
VPKGVFNPACSLFSADWKKLHGMGFILRYTFSEQ